MLAVLRDILHVIASHCRRSDLGRLQRTCRQLRAAGSCDDGLQWRAWTSRAEPLAVCAALRSSIAHQRRRPLHWMLDELHKSGCDMSSAVALPCDMGCALFACALHVDDATVAHELLALVPADDRFEALLSSIKHADVIAVHYILRDIVDALDMGQCEQLRKAAQAPMVQGDEFVSMYCTVRRAQTHYVVFDALYP